MVFISVSMQERVVAALKSGSAIVPIVRGTSSISETNI